LVSGRTRALSSDHQELVGTVGLNWDNVADEEKPMMVLRRNASLGIAQALCVKTCVL
jgi:hypothetical protein